MVLMKYIDLPEKEIIDLYLNKKYSIAKLASLYKVSRDCISLRLKKNNIKTLICRKYKNIDEHYFDNIDSEEKAYFLGLLFADGCNHRDKITIDLQENDRLILQKLSKTILGEDATYYKKINKGKNQYRVTIYSEIICDRLNELGCVPRKSLILEFPKLDIKLQKHFIRGYFDGDGCICENNNKYYFSIVSTKNFCNEVAIIIKNNVQINILFKLCCENNITTVLYIKGNIQIKKILDWMYKDANIFLDRKYNKYLELSGNYLIY
jgi:intein/homing endonuclease